MKPSAAISYNFISAGLFTVLCYCFQRVSQELLSRLFCGKGGAKKPCSDYSASCMLVWTSRSSA